MKNSVSLFADEIYGARGGGVFRQSAPAYRIYIDSGTEVVRFKLRVGTWPARKRGKKRERGPGEGAWRGTLRNHERNETHENGAMTLEIV